MFVNKNVIYKKTPNPVFTEFPCDGGDNDGDDEVDGSNEDVCLDNVNAGDGERKVDLADLYNRGGGSNVGVDDVGGVNTNGGNDSDFANGDSKSDFGDDRGSGHHWYPR